MLRTLLAAIATLALLGAISPAAADPLPVGTTILECEDPQQYDSDGDGSDETWTSCHGPPCLAVESVAVGVSGSVTAQGQETHFAAGANGGCYGAAYGSEDEEGSGVDAQAEPHVHIPSTLDPCAGALEPDVCP